MTIVLNEIQLLNGFNHSFIIAAADQRITFTNNKTKWHHKKLHKIPYLNGAISYFGLAQYRDSRSKNDKDFTFTHWLPNYINSNSKYQSLKDFSFALQDELNNLVPKKFTSKYPSGFHICGYNDQGFPDFWVVKNFTKYENGQYIDIGQNYQAPESHFLSWSVRENFGENWLQSIKNHRFGMVYRNGTIEPHQSISDLFDFLFAYIANNNLSDFMDINHDIVKYTEFVKSKLDFMIFIHNKWTKRKVIGGKIDILLIEKKPNSLPRYINL